MTETKLTWQEVQARNAAKEEARRQKLKDDWIASIPPMLKYETVRDDLLEFMKADQTKLLYYKCEHNSLDHIMLVWFRDLANWIWDRVYKAGEQNIERNIDCEELDVLNWLSNNPDMACRGHNHNALVAYYYDQVKHDLRSHFDQLIAEEAQEIKDDQ